MKGSTLLDEAKGSAGMFGIEYIWQLSDYYEQKKFDLFTNMLSEHYKDAIREKLQRVFAEHESIKLFIHLRTKQVHLDKHLHCYEICWSRRVKKHKSIFLEKHSGKAMVMFKESDLSEAHNFYLCDIKGDNPFVGRL